MKTADDLDFSRTAEDSPAASTEILTERTRAEETLRLSNAYNRSLIEASLDPLVTIGPDGKITDVNAATELATGRSRGELVGTDFCDYFSEPAQARAGYQQVFREGMVRDYPLELQHRDGRVMSVLYNASVYRDELGRVIGVFAAARDVTERKRAEDERRMSDAQLAHERDRLQLLLEIHNYILGKLDIDELFHAVAGSVRQHLGSDAVGFWLIDKESGCLERRLLDFPTGNGALASVVVTVPTNLESESWRLRRPQPYSPQQMADLPIAIREAARAEGIVSAVLVPLVSGVRALGLMTLSSRKADAFSQVDLDLLSQIGTQISLALDNALAYGELRASRDGLRLSEAYLAEAQRLSHTGSWAFDVAADKYVYVSEECFRIFDLDPQNGLPTRETISRLIHPEDWDSVNQSFVKTVREKVDTASEFRIVTRKRTFKHVLTLRHAVVDDDGELVRVLGTVVDITERKLAEEELRESEMRFRTFVDHAADAFAILDEHHKVVDVNREACESLGYSREEAIGMVPRDFDVDIDDARLQRISEQIDRGEACTFESRHRRKDGTVFPVEVRVLSFQRGGRRFHLASARNISERKRAEEDRREQAERFRAIADYTYDWENWFGVDGKLLWVNPAVERITGYSVDECMAMQDFPVPLVAEADRQMVEPQLRGAVEGSKRNDFEFRVRHKNGHLAWVAASWQPIYDSQGAGLGYRSSIRDIAERKRAEEALQRSEAYLADAQRMSHTGSWAFDVVSNGYVYLSEEWCRIFEFDPKGDSPDREAVSRLIHREDLEGVNRSFEKSVCEKVDTSSEFRIVLPGGRIKHLFTFRHPVLNDAGEIVELLGTVIDITERKRAEAALRESEDERRRAELTAQEARAQLERIARLRTMGELAASIAHEVNQPLAGLITSANAGLNWLAGEPPNVTKAREALARVVRDGTRAGEIVARIRGAVKRAPSLMHRVNMNHVVRDVMPLMMGELQQCKVEVSLGLGPSVSDVLGDSIQLQQVLLNIVKNGIDAMAEIEDRPRVLSIESALGELDGKPAVVLKVSDTGPGLRTANVGRLFEPFNTTKPHGMGMGLWISRLIIEAHNGCLTAHDNIGPGATFRILLPAANGDAA